MPETKLIPDLLTRAEALAKEHEQHDKVMTPGEWSVWTSNSFRRITAHRQPDGGVLRGALQRPDGHPDLNGNNRDADLEGICFLHNAAPEVSTLLRELVAEVERLAAALPNWSLADTLQQRNALLQMNLELRTELRLLQKQRAQAEQDHATFVDDVAAELDMPGGKLPAALLAHIRGLHTGVAALTAMVDQTDPTDPVGTALTRAQLTRAQLPIAPSIVTDAASAVHGGQAGLEDDDAR
jgi:hypothetical protein